MAVQNVTATLTSRSRASLVSPIVIDVVFGESVTGFTKSNVTPPESNSRVSSITITGSGTTYVVTIILADNLPYALMTFGLTGMVTVSGQMRPIMANTVREGTSTPTITAVIRNVVVNNTTRTITMDVVFPERVGGFDATDVNTTNNANVSGPTITGFNANYTLTYTFSSGASGTISVHLTNFVTTYSGGTFHELARSNTVSATFGSGTSVTLTGPNGIATAPYTVSAVFNRVVTNFTQSDISITNGTISGFTGSGNMYSFTVTPPSSGMGNTVITVTGMVTSGGSSVTPTSNTLTVAYEEGLTVTLGAAVIDNNARTIRIPVTFSHSVTGFDATDVNTSSDTSNVTGPTVSGSGTSWTIAYTSALNTYGTINVYVSGTFTIGSRNRVATSQTINVSWNTLIRVETFDIKYDIPKGVQTGAFDINITIDPGITQTPAQILPMIDLEGIDLTLTAADITKVSNTQFRVRITPPMSYQGGGISVGLDTDTLTRAA